MYIAIKGRHFAMVWMIENINNYMVSFAKNHFMLIFNIKVGLIDFVQKIVDCIGIILLNFSLQLKLTQPSLIFDILKLSFSNSNRNGPITYSPINLI